MKQSAASILFLCLGLALAAQSNAFIDGLLDNESVTYGQIAYLAMTASGRMAETADEASCLEAMKTAGWIPRAVKAGASPRLDEYCLVVVRSLGIGGGVMLSLFPSPRYAYLELESRQVFSGPTDPGMEVSGLLAYQILGRAADLAGGGR